MLIDPFVHIAPTQDSAPKLEKFFFHWAIWARSTHNNNLTNMPGVNSKMATKPDPINDEETAETVNVIDRLNEENAA